MSDLLLQMGTAIPPGLTGTLGLSPVASPMHRATAREQVRLVNGEGTVVGVAKRLHSDMLDWVDWSGSVATQRHAAQLGVAPNVWCAVPENHVHVEQWMGAPWRTATLADLSQPAVLDAVLATKKKLHANGPLPEVNDLPDVFERIARLSTRLRLNALGVPADLDWLIRRAEAVREAIGPTAERRTLCHGDGSSGNVLLGPDGAVMLVDYDLARNEDPHLDLAATLVESCELDEDWAAALERTTGIVDRATLARLRLYGFADDLMWGLWGCLCSTASRRGGIEFFKYGQWRLLRSRQVAVSWPFEQWLRTAGV
ncbi:Phosphotransferase enzyme family protein [Variovorax sp. YR750]|uniref:aminoglycoside phosphotransferase family protein n=1 Tax=Variovorax sp. YR750 TaxID=1884384 RepID=UPI0008C3C13E|nr:aminoglycoside phosphotransferase family protein [Variovorax sp. YR750]SEM04758.1 Phosphotransferase enzyme family protein [Variovorax sp. YR750]